MIHSVFFLSFYVAVFDFMSVIIQMVDRGLGMKRQHLWRAHNRTVRSALSHGEITTG